MGEEDEKKFKNGTKYKSELLICEWFIMQTDEILSLIFNRTTHAFHLRNASNFQESHFSFNIQLLTKNQIDLTFILLILLELELAENINVLLVKIVVLSRRHHTEYC